MFQRCYSQEFHLKEPSYIGCIVCEEWHDFQNFARFYDTAPYREDGWHLDKDILHKGNKLYAPDMRVFVPPKSINCLSGDQTFEVIRHKVFITKRDAIDIKQVCTMELGRPCFQVVTEPLKRHLTLIKGLRRLGYVQLLKNTKGESLLTYIKQ